MLHWETILVVVIVLVAAVWLALYYRARKKEINAGKCAGDCADCAFAQDGCQDPELRDRFFHRESSENKPESADDEQAD